MDELLALFSALFTPEQQRALLIITIMVMVATQVFKKIYFGFRPLNNALKKGAILWSFAFSFGLVCGVVGFFVAIPPQPLWFWLFTGVVSGGGAIGLFDLFISIDWLDKFGIKKKRPQVIQKNELVKLEKESPDDPTQFMWKDDGL